MGFVKKKKQSIKEKDIKLIGRERKEGRKVIKQKSPYFCKMKKGYTVEL